MSKSATFKKSGSYDPGFTSSEELTSSLPLLKTLDKRGESGSSHSNLGSSPERPANIPKFISVERRELTEEEEEFDDLIDEEMLKPPPGKEKKVEGEYAEAMKIEDPPQKKEMVDISARYEMATINVQPLSPVESQEKLKTDEEDKHPYANWDVAQVNSVAAKANATSPKKTNVPKKPMPIQRKKTPVEDQPSEPEFKPSTATTASSTVSATPSVASSGVKNVPKKPLPPQKPRKLVAATPMLSPSQTAQKSKPYSSSISGGDRVNITEDSAQQKSSERKISIGRMASPDRGPLSSKSTPYLPDATKPRSHTTSELGSSSLLDKKQPILPPASKVRSKSPSPTSAVATASDDSALSSSKPLAKPEELNRSKPFTSSSSQNSNSPKPPKLQKMTEVSPASGATKVTAATVLGGGAGKTTVIKKPVAPSNSQSGSGGSKENELMRKLSLRRQRIEQQTALLKPTTSVSKIAEVSSERNSTISTSSSHSEVVVAYRRIEESSSLTSLSSNSTGMNLQSDSGSSLVELRKQPTSPEKEGGNLAKYGIIEDVDGGSYVI